ncbi:hypothetical protein [Aminobacter niigataensis]|uniref:hypothetical protein n=1 Tax=Aminobacter niigataensis TaxID=83265 RepID=UPI001605E64F|nr:hypothetical protein [Aminobacter niigataensis]
MAIQLHRRDRQPRLRPGDDQQPEVSCLRRKQEPRQRRVVFIALGEMIVVEEQVQGAAQPLQLGQDDAQNMLLRQTGIILRRSGKDVCCGENSEQSEEEVGAVAIVAIQRGPGCLVALLAQILVTLVHQRGLAEAGRCYDQRQAPVAGIVEQPQRPDAPDLRHARIGLTFRDALGRHHSVRIQDQSTCRYHEPREHVHLEAIRGQPMCCGWPSARR